MTITLRRPWTTEKDTTDAAMQVGNRCADTALTGAAELMRQALRDDPIGLTDEFQRGWLAACDAMDAYAQKHRDRVGPT